MTNFVNLTQHSISIQLPGEELMTILSSGVARVASSSEVVATLDGIPIRHTTFGEVTGLPDPVNGTIFIVSLLVAQAARRVDVVSPDTGPSAIRENGQVKAVTGLVLP